MRHQKMSVCAVIGVLFSIFTIALCRPEARATCGYDVCPTGIPGMINVHIVPHTHDDVGWLKNIDQYYYGSRNSIQQAGVQYVLDSVIDELLLDANKRFIWVETAFFWQWWLEKDDALRAQVVDLVNNGRLEFTGGAWSMHDEAVSHYQCILDSFTWGFRKLSDTFGECGRPRIGWQIDPFGHSRESASIMAQIGFDGLFFARLDYQDKDIRMDAKTAELIWQASANLGESSWLFTHVLFNHYSPPPGFCFDIKCNDAPFIDNIRSPDYNVDSKVDDFLDYTLRQNASYTSGNLIMLMGEDFHYQSARMWFKNTDKLIKYVNARQVNGSNVNIFYSTPSCYVKAVHDAGLTWTTKQDDFFPYPNDANSYWTGYFTSRPTLKYMERKGNNLLQVTKQLHSLARQSEDEWTDIASLREMMGAMQHHDAITGTEKQQVAESYALNLHNAVLDADLTVENAINKLIAKNGNSPRVNMSTCFLANSSQCQVLESADSSFMVIVYNPLSRKESHHVRIPVVPLAVYTVYDTLAQVVQSDTVPVPATVLAIPGRVSESTNELWFVATDIPPLGFKTYYVLKSTANKEENPIENVAASLAAVASKTSIGNEYFRLHFEENGKMYGISFSNDKEIILPFENEFLYYNGADNIVRNSGAYVFRPDPNTDGPLSLGAPIETATFVGDVVEEVHQTYNDWVSLIIRVRSGEPFFEFEWLVGPIPIDDNIGKEVILRYKTSLSSNATFYTDSNGREVLERRRDYRPTWDVDIKEPESGNYYPITSMISLTDGVSTLAVLPDRAQGGSSLKDGEIELMLHRRLLHDDGYGVSEALNETAFGEGLVARGRHIVYLDNGASNPTIRAKLRQLTQKEMLLTPWVLVSPSDLTLDEWKNLYLTDFSGAYATNIPANVHILTLEPWGANRMLLRLEHMYETNDDPVLSQPASVTIEDIFPSLTITSLQEMTLGGNQLLSENQRFNWTVEGEITTIEHLAQEPVTNPRAPIIIEPMQIRTFILQLSPAADSSSHRMSSIITLLFASVLLTLRHYF